MAITAYSTVRTRNMTTVTVTSDLTGTVYYYWYLDGTYVGRTTQPTMTFYLGEDDQVRIYCLDSHDAALDPDLNAPTGYPARRTLFWVRSVDEDVSYYKIEQQADAGGWSEIGRVHQDDGAWTHTFVTGRLTDLSSYDWRITPVDAAGNSGTANTLATEKVVRTPDAPSWSFTFDSGTSKVTFASA